MKKNIALFLAVLMVVALCAGCGEKEAEPAAEPAAEPVAEAAPAAEPAAEPAAPDAAAPDAAVPEAAPEAPTGDKKDAGVPSGDKKASGVPSGDKASGTPSGEGETGQAQTLELFSADGYEKSWAGYVQYCIAAQESDAKAPPDIVAQNVADLQAATEDSYDPTASPFGMMIEFGLVMTYEDFLK